MGRRLSLLVLAAAALLGASSAASAAPFVFTSTFHYSFPFTDHTPEAVAVGDLNGDGLQDIVVGEFDGKLGIFLNHGDGSFASPQFIPGACFNQTDGIAGVAIGTFSSSGHPDILVGCDDYQAGFFVYPGNGDGTFGTPVEIEPIQVYDGRADGGRGNPVYEGVELQRMVHGSFGGTQAVAWNEFEAGGAFVLCMMTDAEIAAYSSPDIPAPHCSVDVVDDTAPPVDELEFPRPVVLGTLPFPSPGSDWAFTGAPADAGLNNAAMRGAVFNSGFFSDDIEPPDAMPATPSLLAAPDLNGDGSSELIAEAGANNEDIAVYQLSSFVDNGGVLIIPDPTLYPTSPALNGVYGAVSGDFTGDGHLDVAVLGTNPTTVNEYVEVFPGDGSGGLGAPQSFQVADFTSDSLLATADFNGDGHPDLLTIVDDDLTVFLDTVQHTLTVNKTGTGTGAVVSVPAGIDCGATCSHAYADGTPVTLTATTAPGSVFAGWSGGGCSGTGTCQVTLSSDTTVAARFTPPPPSISSFAPSQGGQHATVTVTGTNFTGTTAVQLNGQSAAFAVVSPTTITFTVPTGASSGTVRVVAPGGSATSAGPFTVLPPPVIASFAPTSGPVGTVVTVTGTELAGTVAVQVGGVLTVPTSASATQVVFTVPPGAVTGPIKLLSPGGAATSVGTFTVT